MKAFTKTKPARPSRAAYRPPDAPYLCAQRRLSEQRDLELEAKRAENFRLKSLVETLDLACDLPKPRQLLPLGPGGRVF